MAERPLFGHVALVTGSTGGIGEGIARCLAAKGANVIVNGFGDEDYIRNLVSTLKSECQVDVVYIHADLSKESDIETLYAKAVSTFPQGIDILVNNAGWGRIINIASAHGHVASPNKTAYVSAKHGLVGLTKTIALETAGTGVTCTALCPGYVETPLFVKQAEDRAKDQNISYEEGKRQILQVHPSGEAVKIEEVAEAVAFLCSKTASQITGCSLMMDGGWTTR